MLRNLTIPYVSESKKLLLFFLTLVAVLAFGLNHLFFAKNAIPVSTNVKTRYFQIAVLGDTQYYTAEKHGGNMEMFYNQIDWITANAEKEQIAYVVHVGDITDHGDNTPIEWERAKDAMYRLEKPRPGLPHGIPYGVAVGNHDVRPNGDPNGTLDGYRKYFGRDHFKGRNYYGGSYKDEASSRSHYDLFEANGEKFIALYLVFNDPGRAEQYDAALQEEMHNWGGEVLTKYADRKAIIVSHSMLKPDSTSTSKFVPNTGNNPKEGSFTKQGRQIVQKFKHYPNVFLMLCGHISGEAYKEIKFEGRSIKILLTDFQGRRKQPFSEKDRNGGGGALRLMKFDQDARTLTTRTFIPEKSKVIAEEDHDSNLTLPLKN